MFKQIKIENNLLNYEINENGEIRNIKTQQYLKHKIKTNGYHEVCLYINKKKKYLLIHRLVALVFIENPNNLPQVNHIDGNKDNNYYKNLEWVDSRKNNKHAWENSLNKPSVLRKVEQYDLDGKYIKTYNSIAEAKKSTNAAKISMVANGERKSSGGYIWKWAEDFIPRDTGKNKKVAQYDLNNNLINTYKSITIAAKETSSSRTGISACCKNKQLTCNNFIWKYVKDDIVH